MANATAPDLPSVDLSRLHEERQRRLRAEMQRQEVDGAVLLHGPHVTYATGHLPLPVDVSHATYQRPVAVVGGDDLDVDLIDPARGICVELDEDADRVRDAILAVIGDPAGQRIMVDSLTGAMVRAGVLDGADLVDAARVLGPIRLCKTEDELACIESAQLLNETQMEAVRNACVPGVTRAELAGVFLEQQRALEAATDTPLHNQIDPIFQAIPRRREDGPFTFNGHAAFPTGVGNARFEPDDLIWVDSGQTFAGYASDFGRTWIVGRDPSPAEVGLFERWLGVMDASHGAIRASATLGDVGRAAIAANDGDRPWLPHFYLAHGLGLESAEMPMVGSDLGQEFDDGFVLEPGMILVLEPVIWQDGIGSYRAEEIVAVTETGHRVLGESVGHEPYPS